MTDATEVSSSSATSAGLPAEHLAEDEHRALARRQVLERRHEGEANRLVLDGEIGRIRDRLEPRHLRCREVLDHRVLRGAEIHRPGAALPRLQHVEATLVAIR